MEQIQQLKCDTGNYFALESIIYVEQKLTRLGKTTEHSWKAQVIFAALLVPAGLDVHSNRSKCGKSIRTFIAEHHHLSKHISIVDEAVAAQQQRQFDALHQSRQAYTSSSNSSIDDCFPLDNDTTQLVVSYLVT